MTLNLRQAGERSGHREHHAIHQLFNEQPATRRDAEPRRDFDSRRDTDTVRLFG
jgi:hypothetical protein